MEITASAPDEVGLTVCLPEAVEGHQRHRVHAGADRRRHRGHLDDARRAEGRWPLFGKVISMDRLVGKDFEKGLARLKAAAEA